MMSLFSQHGLYSISHSLMLTFLFFIHSSIAVERRMLNFLPFAKICQIQRPASADARQRAARLQELLHYCTSDGISKSGESLSKRGFFSFSFFGWTGEGTGEVRGGLRGKGIGWVEHFLIDCSVEKIHMSQYTSFKKKSKKKKKRN